MADSPFFVLVGEASISRRTYVNFTRNAWFFDFVCYF